MAVTILVKGKAKRDLIREVAQAWIEKSPAMAREMADYLQEITHLERAKCEGRQTFVKVRVPQELFFTLRYFLPDFGDNDKDIEILAEEFPRLVHCRTK